MEGGWTLVLGTALAAAVASPLGGAIALWRAPTSTLMSVALGFAGGVLLGTIGFEMMPKALELASIGIAVGGFVVGFVAVYGFDLFVHRGMVAGPKAEQRKQVERYYRQKRPRGDEITVLAGGTSVEELIEGVSIGVGAAIMPELGLIVALAVVIDNFSEGLAIGEMIRSESKEQGGAPARRILGWTSLMGAAVLVSALAGWFLLRDLPQPVLGFLFGAGAGGMFYLTVTNLVPEAEERQFQQIPAVAIGIGFMVIFVLASLAG